MAGKSFADYQAEHTKAPFELPMPDGTTIAIPQGSVDEQRKVRAVILASDDPTLFTGIEVIVGDAAAEKIAAAWGTLPVAAWNAVMEDREKHFGRGNSDASPPS